MARHAAQPMPLCVPDTQPSADAQERDTGLLVYITMPEKSSALTLAQGLVENHLAAGANVAGPVQSFYRWQGTVRSAEEWQIFAQTGKATFPALENWVLAHHPHKVPCIIAASLIDGHGPFLNWIDANSAGSQSCK